MKRSFIVISLLALLSFLSFQDLMNYAIFKVFQTEIIANLCINKDQPTLKCNGKCHLSKVIAQTKDNTSSDIPMPAPERLEITFLSTIPTSVARICPTFLKTTSFYFLLPPNRDFISGVFHPPSA